MTTIRQGGKKIRENWARQIRLNRVLVLIDKRKRRTQRLIEALSYGKATYKDLGKLRVALLREFYQASCGIEGFLGKGGEKT